MDRFKILTLTKIVA